METKHTLPKILSETRHKRGLSIEEIAQTLYLPPRYLSMMEEGRWDQFPSLTHLRGYLKLYLSALRLDPGLMAVFDQESERERVEDDITCDATKLAPQRDTTGTSDKKEALFSPSLFAVFLVIAIVLVNL